MVGKSTFELARPVACPTMVRQGGRLWKETDSMIVPSRLELPKHQPWHGMRSAMATWTSKSLWLFEEFLCCGNEDSLNRFMAIYVPLPSPSTWTVIQHLLAMCVPLVCCGRLIRVGSLSDFHSLFSTKPWNVPRSHEGLVRSCVSILLPLPYLSSNRKLDVGFLSIVKPRSTLEMLFGLFSQPRFTKQLCWP